MKMQRSSVSFACLAIAACMQLTAAVQDASAEISVRDASGRTVVIRDFGRIVSVGGSITEILYALGRQDSVAAVDVTSLHPPEALRQKPNVGYLRQLSPEGVLGLAPSLVLAAEGAGPKEAVAVIEKAGVPVVHVPDRFDGEGIVEKIRLIAAATGAEIRGRCLADQVRRDLAELSELSTAVADRKRVLFILSFVNGRAMVAGRGTAAAGIIGLSSGINAADDFEGYKTVSDEAIIAARPDVVLGMKRPGFMLQGDEVFAHAAFAMTPAARNRSFVAMDGLYLLGFGPRTARAARDLVHALYPEIAVQPLPSERGNAGPSCGAT